jgi:predicted dehydrogenase
MSIFGRSTPGALQAGKHVLVEKPLTTNLEESKQIIDMARTKGLTTMTLYNHRWIPAYMQAKSLLETSGSKPIMGYARKNDRIFVPTEMIRWSDRTTCAYFLSSHDIDLMNWFMDSKVTEVYANAVNSVLQARGINTPDAIQIQAKYANGAIATFESCWVYPNSFPTMTDSLLEIVTENEVIHLPRINESVEYAGPESYNYPRNQLNLNVLGKQRGSTPSAIQHFIDCVLDKQEPYVTLESSHHISAILDAAHKSIATGLPVMVTE